MTILIANGTVVSPTGRVEAAVLACGLAAAMWIRPLVGLVERLASGS